MPSDGELEEDAVEFSSEEEDVIEFEEQQVDTVGASAASDHDPLDDLQECCGKKTNCTKRAVRKVLGLSLVAVAALMFSFVTLGVKSSIHDGMEFCGVLVFRSLVSWIINVAVMIFRKFPLTAMLGTKEKVPLQMILGFFGAFSQMFAFYAVSVLSMADANVYMMTSPVFVFILARVWLGDPVDYVDVISAAVCIVGVIFVSRPSAIFGCDETDDCGLTQFCNLDSQCVDCGSEIDNSPFLLETITTENYTAYEICRGVEQLSNETLVMPDEPNGDVSIVGPVYCDTTGGMEAQVMTPTAENNCHYSCLHVASCDFFTSGWVGPELTCILYIGEDCNTTNMLMDVPGMNGRQFTSLETHPPTLYRMLGEFREADNTAKGLAICLAILSALLASVTYCVIRKLGHGVDGLVCVNYFSLISTLVAAVGAAFQGLPLPLHPEVWAAVVGTGVAGFVGQYTLTVGFQLEKPGPASVIRYVTTLGFF